MDTKNLFNNIQKAFLESKHDFQSILFFHLHPLKNTHTKFNFNCQFVLPNTDDIIQPPSPKALASYQLSQIIFAHAKPKMWVNFKNTPENIKITKLTLPLEYTSPILENINLNQINILNIYAYSLGSFPIMGIIGCSKTNIQLEGTKQFDYRLMRFFEDFLFEQFQYNFSTENLKIIENRDELAHQFARTVAVTFFPIEYELKSNFGSEERISFFQNPFSNLVNIDFKLGEEYVLTLFFGIPQPNLILDIPVKRIEWLYQDIQEKWGLLKALNRSQGIDFKELNSTIQPVKSLTKKVKNLTKVFQKLQTQISSNLIENKPLVSLPPNAFYEAENHWVIRFKGNKVTYSKNANAGFVLLYHLLFHPNFDFSAEYLRDVLNSTNYAKSRKDAKINEGFIDIEQLITEVERQQEDYELIRKSDKISLEEELKIVYYYLGTLDELLRKLRTSSNPNHHRKFKYFLKQKENYTKTSQDLILDIGIEKDTEDFIKYERIGREIRKQFAENTNEQKNLKDGIRRNIINAIKVLELEELKIYLENTIQYSTSLPFKYQPEKAESIHWVFFPSVQ